jgi:hypothetical protein
MKTSSDTFAPIEKWFQRTMISRLMKALEKRNFSACYCTDKTAARKKILQKISRSASVGIGGSVTIRELDIIEKLEKRGNKVIHHWKKGLTEETDRDVRLQEGSADYYLTSANAITLSGDIINIDGVGNRVAAMIYGPKSVIIVAGFNKIVSSMDEGIKRSKHIAGVMNAKRIGAKTPCAQTGMCVDCNAQQRICRVTTILQYRPWQTDIMVMLVNEELGF